MKSRKRPAIQFSTDTTSIPFKKRGSLLVPEFYARAERASWTPLGSTYRPPVTTPPARYLRLDVRDKPKLLDVFVIEPRSGTKKSLVIGPAKRNRTDPTQQREVRVTIDLGAPMTIERSLLPYDGSEIRIIANGADVTPLTAMVETVYYTRRRSQPKILNRVHLRNERPTADVGTTLQRFRLLVGVDTNSDKHSNGCPLHITTICLGAVAKGEPGRSVYEAEYLGTFVRTLASDKPEREGWKIAIDHVAAMNLVPQNSRVAVIVDSELDNLAEYNERRASPVDGWTVPQGFEFVFATSDAGTQEYAPNHLIAMCEQRNKVTFNAIRNANLRDGEIIQIVQPDEPSRRAATGQSST